MTKVKSRETGHKERFEYSLSVGLIDAAELATYGHSPENFVLVVRRFWPVVKKILRNKQDKSELWRVLLRVFVAPAARNRPKPQESEASSCAKLFFAYT